MLLIIGASSCGRALAHAASLLNFSIVVADTRADLADRARFEFAHVEQVLLLPEDFEGLPPMDENTYVALLTRGVESDETALRRVIDSPVAYIGMMGNQAKRETIFENLRLSGISEEKIAFIHSPIGYKIGGETPEEIAVCILAEIIEVRAKLKANRLLAAAPK